ncbi:MAG: hypothetical protein HOM96_01705 [Rickettsiales bacterium]|jgi:hypothetical protein|nr:hypothetical protein [Rickettsiales bacterium]
MDSGITVTIYQPRKSAMTQGNTNLGKWKIRFSCLDDKYTYDLMQWNGTKNMNGELNLEFESKDQAIKFATKKQWQYQVEASYEKVIINKSYTDNFK